MFKEEISKNYCYNGENAELYDALVDFIDPYYNPLLEEYIYQVTFHLNEIEKSKVSNKAFRILDLGCGTGAMLLPLINRYSWFDFVSLDRDQSMLCVYEKKIGDFRKSISVHGDFCCPKTWDAARIAAKGESYDLIVSGNALHHLESEQKFCLFEEVFSAMNEDGFFVNADLVDTKINGFGKRFENELLEHVKKLQNSKSFTDILSENGICVEEHIDSWVNHLCVENKLRTTCFRDAVGRVDSDVDLLLKAGFSEVEETYRKRHTSLLWAKK